MPNTLEMITGFFKPRKCARISALEHAADASAHELTTRTAARRTRNDKTRANMSVRRVQDACKPA